MEGEFSLREAKKLDGIILCSATLYSYIYFSWCLDAGAFLKSTHSPDPHLLVLIIHLSINTCIYLFIHPPIHSSNQSIRSSTIQTFVHPCIFLLIYSFIHSEIQPSIRLSIQPFIHLPFHNSILSFIHPIIRAFIWKANIRCERLYCSKCFAAPEHRFSINPDKAELAKASAAKLLFALMASLHLSVSRIIFWSLMLVNIILVSNSLTSLCHRSFCHYDGPQL